MLIAADCRSTAAASGGLRCLPRRSRKRGAVCLDLSAHVAPAHVVVHQAHRLHECVRGRGPDERPAPLAQFLAHGGRLLRGCLPPEPPPANLLPPPTPPPPLTPPLPPHAP